MGRNVEVAETHIGSTVFVTSCFLFRPWSWRDWNLGLCKGCPFPTGDITEINLTLNHGACLSPKQLGSKPDLRKYMLLACGKAVLTENHHSTKICSVYRFALNSFPVYISNLLITAPLYYTFWEQMWVSFVCLLATQIPYPSHQNCAAPFVGWYGDNDHDQTRSFAGTILWEHE